MSRPGFTIRPRYWPSATHFKGQQIFRGEFLRVKESETKNKEKCVYQYEDKKFEYEDKVTYVILFL